MKRLTHFYKGLYFDSEGYNRLNGETDKLGQLEDIEQELGIDLITLFKALKEGAWFKYDYDMFEYVEAKRLYLRTDVAPCAIDYLENVEKHYLKDYGKTWALTLEELENEIYSK